MRAHQNSLFPHHQRYDDIAEHPSAISTVSRSWKPAEQIKTYAISGDTGGALYQSIGERGPTAGVQAIAHTTFKLTWRRDYRPQPDGACVLATAKPNLTIIYTWPKA